MSSLRVVAPGKINLGLRVTGRRPDGYHLLESVFLPLDLTDSLEISLLTEPGRLELELGGDAEGVPDDDRNLAVRAARAFCSAVGSGFQDGTRKGDAPGVALSLTKRIPNGAGLGGGSSDAAAVLRGLDRLCPGTWSRAGLRGLAIELGADVPFFLDPRPARVHGIGEAVEPIDGMPELELLLAHPGQSLSTAAVYAEWDRVEGADSPADPAGLTAPGSASTFPPLRTLLSGGRPPAEWLGQAGLLQNDLEAPATRLCPAVAELRKEMEASEAEAVGLSGSGPTVYGVFLDARAAGHARERMAALPGVRCWLATSLASP